MNSKIISNNIPLDCHMSNEPAIGFPSPAEDHMAQGLDLNNYLIKHPVATFFVRASGHSMRSFGILNNDLLVVDRSLPPTNNAIVLVILKGEFLIRKLKVQANKVFLASANVNDRTIEVSKTHGPQIWGVVTHAIHDVRAC